MLLKTKANTLFPCILKMENTFIQLIFLAYLPSVKLFACSAIKAIENWIKFGFFVLFSGLAVNNR